MSYRNTKECVSQHITNPESLLGVLNQSVLEINLGHCNQTARNIEYVVKYLENNFFELGVTTLTQTPETKTRRFHVFERDKLYETVIKILNSQGDYDLDNIIDALEKVGVVVLKNCVLTLRFFAVDDKPVIFKDIRREV